MGLKPCNDDQERNENTNRCRKKCDANTIRSPKTQKCLKNCKPDQQRNLETNRCQKIKQDWLPKIRNKVMKVQHIDLNLMKNVLQTLETVIKMIEEKTDHNLTTKQLQQIYKKTETLYNVLHHVEVHQKEVPYTQQIHAETQNLSNVLREVETKNIDLTEKEILVVDKVVEKIVNENVLLNLSWHDNSCYIDSLLLSFFGPKHKNLTRVLIPPASIELHGTCKGPLRNALINVKNYIQNKSYLTFSNGSEPVKKLRESFKNCQEQLSEFWPNKFGKHDFNNPINLLHNLCSTLNTNSSVKIYTMVNLNLINIAKAFETKRQKTLPPVVVVEFSKAIDLNEITATPHPGYNLAAVIYLKHAHFTAAFKHKNVIYYADGQDQHLEKVNSFSTANVYALVYALVD